MRKLMLVTLALFLAFGFVLAASPVAVDAQGGPLEVGAVIEDELTDDAFAHEYTFAAEEGQIVLFEMAQAPGTFDADPELLLIDSAGNQLAENSFFNFGNAVIVWQFANAGDYTLVAQRYNGEEGTGNGPYVLRVSEVELAERGSVVEATLNTVDEEQQVDLIVLRPEEAGTYSFSWELENEEYYPDLGLDAWSADGFSDTIFSLFVGSGAVTGTLNAPLEAGQFYILSVEEAFFSFDDEDTPSTVTITIE